jgi:molybdopterin/thiamine biosynthesis adenylyltransferase
MTTELEHLSDRHFLPDPQGVLASRDQTQLGSVSLTIGKEIAASVAGQHIAWMLVNLLCRQFGVVAVLELDIPEVELHTGVAPFGRLTTLRETLLECVRLVSGEHVQARTISPANRCDVNFCVGAAQVQSRAGITWHLYADGWRWYVGLSGAHPRNPPASSLAIGPHLAACFAAAEVFKLLRGMKEGKASRIDEFLGSAWTMSTGDSWEALVDGPSLSALDSLPHFYFAGAGAVAQAAALSLIASGMGTVCTAVDYDRLDLSNDNRYVLSHKQCEGDFKVQIMAAYLREHGVDCNPQDCTWEQYVAAGGRLVVSPALAASERQYKYALVLSCVDENEPRHAIQNLLPRIIVGGSTDGLTAKASTYFLGRRGGCLKCFNATRNRNEVVDDRLRAARAMSLEEQAEFCGQLGIAPAELARLLAPGRCGTLTEADLNRFAAPSPQMSVGFVSAAAGTLMAAQMLRLLTIGAERVNASGATAVATFAKPGLRQIHLAVDSSCDCGTDLRERWRRIWPE